VKSLKLNIDNVDINKFLGNVIEVSSLSLNNSESISKDLLSLVKIIV